MNLPVFPAPTADLVAMARDGKTVKALRAWMTVARAELLDGTVVMPTLRLASDAMKAIAKGMPPMNVLVEEGCYTIAPTPEEIALRDAAALARGTRFTAFMAEGGDDEYPTAMNGTCDHCGTVGPGTMQYAPDGMGFPAAVLFTGVCCLH